MKQKYVNKYFKLKIKEESVIKEGVIHVREVLGNHLVSGQAIFRMENMSGSRASIEFDDVYVVRIYELGEEVPKKDADLTLLDYSNRFREGFISDNQ